MLNEYSEEDLKKELEKRQKKKSTKPEPLLTIDVDSIIKIAKEYIDDIDKNDYVNEDYDRWIYETVLDAVYGKNVWEWINNR